MNRFGGYDMSNVLISLPSEWVTEKVEYVMENGKVLRKQIKEYIY